MLLLDQLLELLVFLPQVLYKLCVVADVILRIEHISVRHRLYVLGSIRINEGVVGLLEG